MGRFITKAKRLEDYFSNLSRPEGTVNIFCIIKEKGDVALFLEES
jgi:hypothetical protein